MQTRSPESIAALIGDIWAEILVLPEAPGPDRDFFDLGGDSLAAMAVTARVGQALGLELPLEMIFATPTLLAYVAAVMALRGELPADTNETAANAAGLPLCYQQMTIWNALQGGFLGPSLMHLRQVMRLDGPLDIEIFRDSLRRLTLRHDVCRMRILDTSAGPRQRADAPLPEMQLLNADSEAEALHLLETFSRTPFQLDAGPLFRACLIRLDADAHLFAFIQHHLVSDLWSVQILLRDLKRLYAALAQGLPDPLPPLEGSYLDFVAWQHELTDSPAYRRQRLFWTAQLAELPGLRWRGEPPGQLYTPKTLDFRLPEPIFAALQALRRQENTTLGVLLLLAWQMLARRWSGQDKFFMIYNGAGRLRPKHQDVAGLFAHYLPIAADLSGDPTPREAIARTHARYRKILAEEGVPAYRALADSGATTGLFINHVALGVGETEAGFGPHLAATPMPDKAQINRLAFPVLIYVFETKIGVSGTIYYAEELFGAAEMEGFAGEFAEIAAGLAS